MGQTIGNFAQASNYKAQASVARSQGRTQQTFFNKRAENLEAEAVSDSHLAALNAGRMRQNQSAAMGTARTQRGASGLTSEGSGQQAEIAIAEVFENAIGDMALSNAISDSNKRHAAEVARFQGNLAMQQADAAASQYNSLAKTARTSGWLQLGSTVAGAGAALLNNIGVERQVPLTDKNGTPVIGLDGKQMMTTNPQWMDPIAYGKSAYDLSGTGLSWMPGALNSGSQNSGAHLFDIFSSIFPSKP